MASVELEAIPDVSEIDPEGHLLRRLRHNFGLKAGHDDYPDMDAVGTREGSFWGKPRRFSITQRLSALALTVLVSAGALEHSRVRAVVGHLPKDTPEFRQKARTDLLASWQSQYEIASADERVDMTFVSGNRIGAFVQPNNGSGIFGWLSDVRHSDNKTESAVWITALDPATSHCLEGGAYDTGDEEHNADAEYAFENERIIIYPEHDQHMPPIILINDNRLGHLEFDTRHLPTRLVAIALGCIPKEQ